MKDYISSFFLSPQTFQATQLSWITVCGSHRVCGRLGVSGEALYLIIRCSWISCVQKHKAQLKATTSNHFDFPSNEAIRCLFNVSNTAQTLTAYAAIPPVFLDVNLLQLGQKVHFSLRIQNLLVSLQALAQQGVRCQPCALIMAQIQHGSAGYVVIARR